MCHKGARGKTCGGSLQKPYVCNMFVTVGLNRYIANRCSMTAAGPGARQTNMSVCKMMAMAGTLQTALALQQSRTWRHVSLSYCSCLSHCFRVKCRYAQARSTMVWTLLTEPGSSGWTLGMTCTSRSFCKYLLMYRELKHPDVAESGCRRAVHQGRLRTTQPCATQAAWACRG